MSLVLDRGLLKRVGAFKRRPARKPSWFERLSDRERSFLRQLPKHEQTWLEKKQFRPSSFALYQFSTKSPSERAEFLSDGRAYWQLQGINGEASTSFLWNKLVFQRALERAAPNISFPKLRGLFRRRELIDANPPHEVTSLDAIFHETAAVVVKPVEGCRGNQVQFITREDFIGWLHAESDRDIAELVPGSVNHDLIIVDRIDQANYASQISPASSNTIRIVCMRRPRSREVFTPFAVHRFGTHNTAPLDNFSKGGLSCSIDITTGKLGPGVMHPSRTNFSLCWHKSHPDTGERIEGLALPNWQRLLDNTTQLMDIFPDLEFVGWDVLPIEDGWCVIEGNAYMDIDLLQAHGGMLADHRVKEFLEYHCSARSDAPLA